MKNKISAETQAESLKIAKSTQRPGQTKQQTKLISQGIEKGIAEYKKQHKAKLREQDKLRKKTHRQNTLQTISIEETKEQSRIPPAIWLPWLLLVMSWAGFIMFCSGQ